jgi:hypothetical protein
MTKTVFYNYMLSILLLGEVSFKVVLYVVIYTVDCEYRMRSNDLRLTSSLSDRIGRKWVLAWLTVLLAVVSHLRMRELMLNI